MWTEAAEAGHHALDLCVAGLHVRIELAGGHALADVVTPALEVHAAAPAGAPDVTIRAVDVAATRTAVPPVLDQITGRQPATAPGSAPAGGLRWATYGGTWLLSDPAGVGHLAVIADGSAMPWWERGAPLRQLLAWALTPLGRHFVHGAAVSGLGGAALLVGPSGAGKSSTSISALLGGLGFLGDDYCILTLDDGPRVHTLYGTVKVVADQMDVIDPDGRLAAHLVHEGDAESKSIAVASRAAPELMVASAPIRAVVVPSLEEPTGLSDLSSATALRHLAPTSVLQLAGAGAGDLAALAQLVRAVPCHRLGLQPDRSANPPVLADLLAAR